MKRVWVIWVSIVLTFGSTILIIDVSEDTQGKVEYNGVEYTPHAPISINTNAANLIIDSTAPLPATNPHAELTGTNDVTIYWNASTSPDVDHYEVWYHSFIWDSTGDIYNLLATVPAGMTNYVHPNRGANNGGSYYYQIRTFDIGGNETRTLIQAAKIGNFLSIAQSEWWLLGPSLVQSNTSLDHVIQGQSMPGAWDYALVWDAPTQRWYSHLKGRPDSLNELTDITNDMGFWLHITGTARFATAGHITDTNYILMMGENGPHWGWNLVAYPYAERSKTTADIEMDLFSGCSQYVPGSLTIFDPTNPYYVKTLNGTEVLQPGDAFWVRIWADCVWTVDNY